MSQQHQEKKLQQEIATYLSEHGWLQSPSSEGYDKERAIFPEDVLGWLEDTDPENFAKVVPPHGDDAARAKGERRVLDRLTSQLSQPERDGGGVLNVLRKGFLVPGARRFKMLQMPPADDRNPQIAARYAQNRLRVVQEVVYSTRKADRIDLVFFLNGLPVATVEIKTDFTQSLQAAIKQYENDRTPAGEPLLTPFRGALVHFALTDHDVYMTTELKGPGTSFLPFNRGHHNGAGNPPNPHGARSSYFWEETLQRDTWLSILTKFVYVNHQKKVDPRTGAEIDRAQIRFPRYHQWRAVSRLTAAAREDGPGHKYLIQHSAGSGKTDSIAWTAHRMATLHTSAGGKVFDTVFVIADRQVLDRQLQDAVDQLVNSTGQFQPITSGSEGSKTGQLIEALSAGVPIIGVTLQTFPYALSKIQEEGGSFAGKRFAVIADEAHSSQSGNAASAVKELLYLNDPTAATGSDSPTVDENGELEPGADQDALVRMAAQADDGHRISYFAFTATPKAKTIELFGTPNEAGKKEPFDLYSMKQAIQEGFILDVLKNYTTYERVAKIALRGSDPANVPGGNGTNGREGAAAASSSGESAESGEVDVRRGTRAYIGFVELHPTNVSSKVDVIVKHYLTTVQPALNGRGKAMVVTGSRAAAVQYQRAFQRHIERENLPLKTLVAFSGTLPDPDVAVIGDGERPEVTEASMNPDVRGRDLAAVFNQDDQNILIVANKYQTGFDQPLLVGMYVDKQLSGIAAVQTLSRLNRRMNGKTDTYVLDFVNDPDQILAAFQEYYEDAEIKTPSDLDLVIKQLEKLKAAAIFTEAEVDQVWQAWNHVHGRHSALLPGLDPAVSRFMERWDRAGDDAAERDTLEEFRSLLGQYVTSYAFFSQILNFGDPEFIKLSVFADLLGRQLNARLDTEIPETVTAEDVVLTHYHLEKQREEDLKLQEDQAEGLRGLTEVGMSKQAERERAAKAELVDSVWRHNDLSEKFAKLLQDMPTDELVSLAMAAGFYERLRGQAG
ncbi:DEAD/DEAH box helicase [Kocuria rhizophila]|nr:DEAD/DEAH box helicase [Kocuria rhizophila]